MIAECMSTGTGLGFLLVTLVSMAVYYVLLAAGQDDDK